MSRHENPVMSRKVRGPKMRLAGFPVLEPFCNAFAKNCATHVRKALGTSVSVDIFGYESMRHGAYLDGVQAPTSIFEFQFRGSGRSGLVRAHPDLLASVLDIYLGGSKTGLLPEGSRTLTPIDVQIYGQFVDLIIRGFDDAIREICGDNALGPITRTRYESDPGMVRVAPDRADVFVIKIGMRIAEADGFAGLDLAMPVAALMPLKDALAETATADAAVREVWEISMRERVLGLPLKTDCVIDLGAFSVGELSRLEQGALLELPPDAMNGVELRVATTGGDVSFVRARLGANGRHKAVRLIDDPSHEFLEPLRQISSEPLY